MDKKILAIMVALIVVAALVVAFVMIAAGGGDSAKGGGFTSLFDDLTYNGTAETGQVLAMPEDWEAGDERSVSDTIVDMSYYAIDIGTTTVYTTTLWFTYIGDLWNSPTEGTEFYVPYYHWEGGTHNAAWIHVDHGMFSITVSSATNLSAELDIGDVITLESTLIESADGILCFGVWTVSDVL